MVMRAPPAVLPLALLGLLLAGPPTAAQRAPAALAGVPSPGSEPAPQLLALPTGLPGAFLVEVRRQGIPHLLSLERHHLRAPDAVLLVGGADGVLREAPLPPVSTYRGLLADDPAATVLARLTSDGLEAQVLPSRGEAWQVRPLGGGLHEVGPLVPDVPDFACGSELLPASSAAGGAAGRGPAGGASPPAPGAPSDASVAASASAGGSGAPGGPAAPALGSAPVPPGSGVGGASLGGTLRHRPPACMVRCAVAFDADHEYYLAKGADVAAVVSAIEGHMNEVEFYYARDVAITYQLTAFVVRTAPFYVPTGGGNLLDLFRAEWEGNLSAIPRDIAHLMTGKPGSLIEYGGLAWVGAVCTSIGYGWSMDGANIVGHEIGHNWNAGHCHDATPCNNMCGACFYIAPVTREIILAYKATRECLTLVPEYAQPLPPYAAPDVQVMRKDDWEGLGTLAFDVLANDDDGNCEPVFVDGVDALSERGATLGVAKQAGPGGRDLVLYTPPAAPFVGADRFEYLVGDAHGGQSAGSARLEVRPLRLVAAWHLDDGAGSVAAGATPTGADGQALGGPLWSGGVLDGALDFDGNDDAVAVPPLLLGSDELTITTWLRRTGPQVGFAGVVFSRDSNATGLNFGNFDRLGYHWNDSPGSYGWNSGLVPPDDAWTFVALAVEPGQATLSMDAGAGLLSAVNAVAHEPVTFDGELHLAWDEGAANRRFDGLLDEVRLYDHALDLAEVALLHDLGGRAEAPWPVDGGVPWTAAPVLSWVPSPQASAHQLYLGSDYAAVRDALPASPEFQGSVGAPSFAAGTLATGQEVFWRVDEVVGATVVPGRVWQFTPPTYHHWPLDELSGTEAADAVGTSIGTYRNGVLLGQPGAKPGTGTAVTFDGVDDAVSVPALFWDSDSLTVTAWVRRDGPQVPWAGLAFWRANSTTTGLGFGDANELRYHWDAGQWGWNSGLVVPDATWVFVALVVEPASATLWLGDGGPLVSAVNSSGHAVEAFDAALWMGRDPGYSNRDFKGSLDEVRVYRAALSPADIAALYGAGG